MTIDNYTSLSNEELVEQISNIKKVGRWLDNYLINNNPYLLNEIIRRTNFLDYEYKCTNKKVPFVARIYCLQKHINEVPKCKNPNCLHDKPILWDYVDKRFRIYCCNKCKSAWINSNEFKEKSQNTCQMLYGDKFFVRTATFKSKSEQTCLKNHGVKHISLSPDWRTTVSQTCMAKYNAPTPLESNIIQDKIKNINLENIGVENPFFSKQLQEQIQEKVINSHGGLGYASDSIKEKAYNTTKQRHGNEHYTQTEEYHKNKRHKYHSEKYPGFTFDSTWEVKVYEFCMDNNIQIEYSPSISYEYEYDGRTWTYHPDFLINGKVYEVKGDHFFKYNESSCQEEMFCPYRNPRWSDDEYDWLCKKFEAKHQCMIKNNVLILRDKDIHNLNVDMFVN